MNCFLSFFVIRRFLLVAKSQWDLRKLRNITNYYQPLINNPKISIFKNKYDLFNARYQLIDILIEIFSLIQRKRNNTTQLKTCKIPSLFPLCDRITNSTN